jgi:hypothetical protein
VAAPFGILPRADFSLIPIIRWNLLRPYSEDTPDHELIGTSRPLSGFGDQARCFLQSYTGVEATAPCPNSKSASQEWWRIHRRLIKRTDINPWLPTSWYGLVIPLRIAEDLFEEPYTRGARVLVPHRALAAGWWLRRHKINTSGSTNVQVLPRYPRPRGRVLADGESAPRMSLQSSYTLLLPEHEVRSQVLQRGKLTRSIWSCQFGPDWYNHVSQVSERSFVGSRERVDFVKLICEAPDRYVSDVNVYMNRISPFLMA